MRHVKQLIYGIFYLACWAALFAGIYFWQRPSASCFDNRKNQDELGVDCGGVCANICIPSTLIPIEVIGDPKIISLGDTASSSRVSLAVQVQNRNANFGARDFGYTFTVYDRSGAVLGSYSDSSFIYASEIKYVVVPNLALPPATSPAYAQLKITDPSWIPVTNFPKPKLLIQSLSAFGANENIVAQGTLVNQDNIDFGKIYLTAIFYGDRGAIVGLSTTELEYIATGARREFTLFHPAIPSAVLERTQVFVTTLNSR